MLFKCYEKIGDFQKALIFYEKSLEIDDSQSDAWLGIGVLRDLNNQTLDALKFIEKAINLDPEILSIGIFLLSFFLSLKDYSS